MIKRNELIRQIGILVESQRLISTTPIYPVEGSEDPVRACDLCQLIEVYKTPLLYLWEVVYNYGKHSDFWNKEDTTFLYIQFEIDPSKMHDTILKLWKKSPPLNLLGDNPANDYIEISGSYFELKKYFKNQAN